MLWYGRSLSLLLFGLQAAVAAAQTGRADSSVSNPMPRADSVHKMGDAPIVGHLPNGDTVFVLNQKPPRHVPRIATLPVLSGYRLGPSFGIFRPVQRNLVQRFHKVSPYYTLGLMPLIPQSGLSISLDYYSIKDRPRALLPPDRKIADNRYFLIGPTVGVRHWFKGVKGFRPYLEADVEYLLGRLRIWEQNLDTKWTQSVGAYILAGALITNHLKLNLSFAGVNPIHGYSMSGGTVSLSYMFMPIGYYAR